MATRKNGLSILSGHKKNGMWLVWNRASELLRQDGSTDAGSVLRRCSHISVSGSPSCSLQKVRESEAGKTSLAGKQSLLYEAILLLRGKEVSSHDCQGCSKRVEAGLAFCKCIGQRVYAVTTPAKFCGSTSGDRDRRTVVTEGAYLSYCSKRSVGRATYIVRWARPFREGHGYVLRVARTEEEKEHTIGGHGYVESLCQIHIN